MSVSTRKRYVSVCVCLSFFPQTTRPENCVDKLHNNKYPKTSLMFAMSVYCTVVPPTTSVFAAFSESWWRTSGCPTWLLLNRRPTGCTGLYLPHCFFFFFALYQSAHGCNSVPVIARGQLWPSLHRDRAHILPSSHTHTLTPRLGPFVRYCMWTCAFLMSAVGVCCGNSIFLWADIQNKLTEGDEHVSLDVFTVDTPSHDSMS